ncbi:unnamed protein product [Mycena citricolor]|uniref:Uncharacterized protein n=1 Tax=Mycena citricolor TaxID=2018698 RepID=A0AAD2HZE1_9AGAR|nr:unnamed protein product [Mycena citricolor]
MSSRDENQPPRTYDNLDRGEIVAEIRQRDQALQEMEIRLNTAEKRARLSDATNTSERHGRGRPRARYNKDDDSADDNEDHLNLAGNEAEEMEEIFRLAGHKLVLIFTFWASTTVKKLLRCRLDDSYDEAKRFTNPDNKIQGEARDFREALAVEGHMYMTQDFLIQKASKAMDHQRSNTSTRVRKGSRALFSIHLPDRVNATDMTDATKREKLFDLIGGRREDTGSPDPTTSRIIFSHFDAPVLHSDGSSTFSIDTFLLNELPIHIAACVLFGPTKAEAMAKHVGCSARGLNMAAIHSIHHTTPGLVANSAMLTLWALSRDEELRSTGVQTGIEYSKVVEDFLSYLLKGLRLKTLPVLNIFHQWDAILFPDTEHSLGNSVSVPSLDVSRVTSALDALDSAPVLDEPDNSSSGGSGSGSEPGNEGISNE